MSDEDRKPENSNGAGGAANAGQPQAKPTKILKRKKAANGYGGGYGAGGYGGYGYGAGYGGYGAGGYGGYGYGAGYGGGAYGGYGYGYGAGQPSAGVGATGGAAAMPNRTFKDYMMILRERIWYIIITFFIILAGILLYTFRITPQYTSMSSIQILRDSDTPIDGPGATQRSRNDTILSMEDFNTQVKLMESAEIVSAVKSRMKEDELKRFAAPYRDMFTIGIPKSEEELLFENRKIIPERMTLFVRITFTHPDKFTAAKIANLFASEYIRFTHQNKVQNLITSIDELRTKVAQQEAKVKELDKKLIEYREKNRAVSLDREDDVDRMELKDLNAILTNDKRVFDSVSTQWEMIQDYKRQGKDLCELPFISDMPQISKLIMDRSTQQVFVSSLEKRYKEKHPKMIEARKTLEQINKELAVAIQYAYQKVESTYQNALKNYEDSQKRLVEKKNEIIDLGKKSIIYKSLERERQVAEGMHASLIASMNVRTAQVSLINEGARIVDHAGPSLRPSSPNYVLNVVLGIFAGLAGGIGVAFLVAFMDDRAKSAYDIESVIGIPLLGIIPRVIRLNSSEKAQVAASNADRVTTEAFRSLYSTLKVNNFAKNAKVVLFTSTTPSEGKSFVVTNLAFTCALNGEKVVIVDADMRLPVLAKTLGLKIDRGLVSYIEQGDSLDNVIVRDFFPNLDVLACEKRALNPMQDLNSEEFLKMLQTLRQRYDKVFVDSPPVGAVSDAVSIMPEVDGVIYVVKFNSAKRKVIKNYIRRMMESNVPILGAVMNMVSSGASSGYSLNYYDKSYQNYYANPPEESEEGSDDVPPEQAQG